MRRFSVFQLVVVLPLIVVVAVLLWREHKRLLYRDSLQSFRSMQAMEGFAHLGDIEVDEGTYVTRMVVTEVIRHNNRVIFDGGSRCVQIVDSQHSDGNADGIAMYCLGNHYETKFTAGLPGTRIKSARFDGNELVMECYGSMRVYDPTIGLDRMIKVPEENPVDFRLPWKSDSRPPGFPELSGVMLEHYRKAITQH